MGRKAIEGVEALIAAAHEKDEKKVKEYERKRDGGEQ